MSETRFCSACGKTCVSWADWVGHNCMKYSRDTIARLTQEVEKLRMQLAACGVAAMCNTKESAEKQRIGKDNPYYSASYQDVCDAVDREMALRTRVVQAEGKVERVKKFLKGCGAVKLTDSQIDELF